MEAFSAHAEERGEDASGLRKARITSLRTRALVRSKGGGGKLSQSASDILAARAPGSCQHLPYPQGMTGSRALSHDSVFWADRVQTDDPDDCEPVRVLSQENVPSKIKTLQMKLQQQKMHLGPPPLLLPIRRQGDEESPQFSTHGTLSKAPPPQPSSRPPSPIFRAPGASPTPVPSPPAVASPGEPPSDLGAPARFAPSLDTSAARHRMSVKPRKQRASAKRRAAQPDGKLDDDVSERPEPAADRHAREEAAPEEEAGGIGASKQCGEAERWRREPAAVAPLSSQELQARLLSRALARPYGRAAAEAPQRKPLLPPGRSSSPEARAEYPEISFHLAAACAESRVRDRPRSGSFAGAPARAGPVGEMTPSPWRREQREDPRPGGGTPGQERKSWAPSPARRDGVKNGQSAKSPDAEPSGEAHPGARVREGGGKGAFAFKLRSASNSVRFWSDPSSGRRSMPPDEERSLREENGSSQKTRAGDSAQAGKASPPSRVEAAPVCLNESQEPESQTASAELSWVSLAVEKTRSLQQLFARRFPKEPSGTPARLLNGTPRAGRWHRGEEALRRSENETEGAARRENTSRATAGSPSGLGAGDATAPSAARRSRPGLGPDEGSGAARERDGAARLADGAASSSAAAKGFRVGLRKAQLESKTWSEPPAQSQDPKPQAREAFRLPESRSPVPIPDGAREEKRTRETPGPSPSPSPSPVFGSAPDAARPSWMELAKRKSMAWSDKTMD